MLLPLVCVITIFFINLQRREIKGMNCPFLLVQVVKLYYYFTDGFNSTLTFLLYSYLFLPNCSRHNVRGGAR